MNFLRYRNFSQLEFLLCETLLEIVGIPKEAT